MARLSELNFDPLDDTKVWPENEFPPKLVGRVVLNSNVGNQFNENEQIAFGTGVLIDGLDFSDDKMLVGRTFSYSDKQRYRVGANYLQLPVNRAKHAKVATNQQGGRMQYEVDYTGPNPHVNYEPSITGGLREATYPIHDEIGPEIRGRLTRERVPRTNDYEQAGQRYQLMEQWERDDLVVNFVDGISQAGCAVQERMVWRLPMCDDELGIRVGDARASHPTMCVRWNRRRRFRRKRTIDAPTSARTVRDVAGLQMTHCVPNERMEVARVSQT